MIVDPADDVRREYAARQPRRRSATAPPWRARARARVHARRHSASRCSPTSPGRRDVARARRARRRRRRAAAHRVPVPGPRRAPRRGRAVRGLPRDRRRPGRPAAGRAHARRRRRQAAALAAACRRRTTRSSGRRGIRLALDRPELLPTQLRAIAARRRPSTRVKMMLPMVADPGRDRAARALLDEARERARRDRGADRARDHGRGPRRRPDRGSLRARTSTSSRSAPTTSTQYTMAAERGDEHAGGAARRARSRRVLRLMPASPRPRVCAAAGSACAASSPATPPPRCCSSGLGVTRAEHGARRCIAEVKQALRGLALDEARGGRAARPSTPSPPTRPAPTPRALLGA